MIIPVLKFIQILKLFHLFKKIQKFHKISLKQFFSQSKHILNTHKMN